jgi:hypothetical protein
MDADEALPSGLKPRLPDNPQKPWEGEPQDLRLTRQARACLELALPAGLSDNQAQSARFRRAARARWAAW